MRRDIMRILAAAGALFILWTAPAWGQGPGASVAGGPSAEALTDRDALHLNTIGAFSAGFVLQAYGYIGVLADVLSKDVYPPDLVRTMLHETITYMRNVNAQLVKYHSGPPIAPGDLEFIAAITEIVNYLIVEAEALSSFSQTKSKDDLQRYDEARRNAWKGIKKTFNMK